MGNHGSQCIFKSVSDASENTQGRMEVGRGKKKEWNRNEPP